MQASTSASATKNCGTRCKRYGRKCAARGACFIGKVFDSLNNPMSPSTVLKTKVRYRFYVTRKHGLEGPRGAVHRAPMAEYKAAVVEIVTPRLAPSWEPDT